MSSNHIYYPQDDPAPNSQLLPWRIELFGELRAAQGRQVLDRFRTRKAAALLAYLAYYRQQSHPREKLADLLWPETIPETGLNNLSSTLSHLRRQFDSTGSAGCVILADRFTLRLNTAMVVTDVGEFEIYIKQALAVGGPERVRLLKLAVEQYQPELLTGHYQEWVPQEQARLSAIFVNAVLRLVEELERAQQHPEALERALEAVRLHPLQEEIHRQVIRLYAHEGRISDALVHYQQLEKRLREELHVGASPTTRAVAQQVQRLAASDPQVHLRSQEATILSTLDKMEKLVARDPDTLDAATLRKHLAALKESLCGEDAADQTGNSARAAQESRSQSKQVSNIGDQTGSSRGAKILSLKHTGEQPDGPVDLLAAGPAKEGSKEERESEGSSWKSVESSTKPVGSNGKSVESTIKSVELNAKSVESLEIPAELLLECQGLQRKASILALEQLVLEACSLRPMTAGELGKLLGRSPAYLRERLLTPLVRSGRLEYSIKKSHHPGQAYRTVEDR